MNDAIDLAIEALTAHLEQSIPFAERQAKVKEALAALRAAQAPEPFWYVVVSKEAPIINQTFRREDVANEYAAECRENGRPGVEVLPLYTAQPQPDLKALLKEAHEVLLKLAATLGPRWCLENNYAGHLDLIARIDASLTNQEQAAALAVQPVQDDAFKMAAASIRALLSLIRREAPALSGKVLGEAEAALAAIQRMAQSAQPQPVARPENLADQAEWLADKLAGNDYVQEAARLLRSMASVIRAVQPAQGERDLPQPKIVVTDTGHAWNYATNKDVKGQHFYSTDQMRAAMSAPIAGGSK